MEEIKNTLEERFPFWPHLEDGQKTLLLNHTKKTVYQKNENIHGGKAICTGVILLQSGSLRAYMLSDEGREITLYRMNPGDVCMMSAACILRQVTFDVFIDAEEESEALLIQSSAFLEVMKRNIYAECFAYKEITSRFSDVMWAMEQILFMSFDKRLALFLLEESEKEGSATIHLTHQQIAKYLGSAREVVSRMLKYFSSEGLVSVQRGDITLLDPKRLRKIL